jgi:hypothetical protein
MFHKMAVAMNKHLSSCARNSQAPYPFDGALKSLVADQTVGRLIRWTANNLKKCVLLPLIMPKEYGNYRLY